MYTQEHMCRNTDDMPARRPKTRACACKELLLGPLTEARRGAGLLGSMYLSIWVASSTSLPPPARTSIVSCAAWGRTGRNSGGPFGSAQVELALGPPRGRSTGSGSSRPAFAPRVVPARRLRAQSHWEGVGAFRWLHEGCPSRLSQHRGGGLNRVQHVALRLSFRRCLNRAQSAGGFGHLSVGADSSCGIVGCWLWLRREQRLPVRAVHIQHESAAHRRNQRGIVRTCSLSEAGLPTAERHRRICRRNPRTPWAPQEANPSRRPASRERSVL